MEVQKHSGLGVASFIASIVSGIAMFLLIVIAGVLEASTPGGFTEQSPGAVIVGLFLFAFLGVSLVALGLGIGGLFQQERKKLFAILGIVFSAATIGLTLHITLIGLAVG